MTNCEVSAMAESSASTSLHRDWRTLEKTQQREWKSQQVERKAVKCWPLSIACLLHTSVHNSCGYLHKAHTDSRQSKFQHRWGQGSWGLTIDWGAIASWWLPKKRESLLFGDTVLVGCLCSSVRHHIHVHTGSTNWILRIVHNIKKEDMKLGGRQAGCWWTGTIKIHYINGISKNKWNNIQRKYVYIMNI